MAYEVVCAVEAEQTETTIKNGFTSDTAQKWEEIYKDVFQDNSGWNGQIQALLESPLRSEEKTP